MPWRIQRVEGFSKCVRDLTSNALKNFDRSVKDLEKSNDPTSGAEFVPTKKFGRCYTLRLTKSYRLAYRIFYDKDIIQLITTGDHKKIYGRD
jgi:mRNA-degrading endonuclease RelE of RelBE toxin-antitoxin system